MTDVATLYVRNIDPEVAARIKRRAEARGITVGAYLEKLEALHDDALRQSELTPFTDYDHDQVMGKAAIERLLIDQQLGPVRD